MQQFDMDNAAVFGTLTATPGSGAVPSLAFEPTEATAVRTWRTNEILWQSHAAQDHVLSLVHDKLYDVAIAWLALHGAETGVPQRLNLASGGDYHVQYKMNHFEWFTNRIGPGFHMVPLASRNCWLKPSVAHDGSGSLVFVPMIKGPSHLAVIFKPATDFEIHSFKEVGSNETGGIKFRLGSLCHILFSMDPAKAACADRGRERRDARFSFMRYIDGDLETFAMIESNAIRAW